MGKVPIKFSYTHTHGEQAERNESEISNLIDAIKVFASGEHLSNSVRGGKSRSVSKLIGGGVGV